MSTTTFRPQQVREPRPKSPSMAGLRRAGESAICEAELMLCVDRRPADRRDSWSVRGLACWLMRDRFGEKYSWSDIALAVFGRRKHNTAIDAARRAEALL